MAAYWVELSRMTRTPIVISDAMKTTRWIGVCPQCLFRASAQSSRALDAAMALHAQYHLQQRAEARS